MRPARSASYDRRPHYMRAQELHAPPRGLGALRGLLSLRALADKVVQGEIAVEVAQVYDFGAPEELYKAMAHAEQAGRGGKILLRFNRDKEEGQ